MSGIKHRYSSWASKKRKTHLLKGKLYTGLRFLKKKLKNKGLVKNILLLLVAGFLFGAILFLGLFAWLSRDLPDPNALTIREIPQSTKIYDRTGEHLLYEIAGDQKRTLVTLEEIPQDLRDATITAEDRKFYQHAGFDIKGLMRAVFTNIVTLDATGQGGSTITQQLVKNAILTSEKTYTRKIKELILALALERRYSKDEILQLYLNEIPYGSTNYGVESAARAYFDKSVSDLTLAESATIAALPQSPSRFLNNPERLLERRNWILNSMKELDYITQEELNTALAQETPVTLSVTGIEAPHFSLWIKEQLELELGERTVEQGGLRVITSLDFDKQKIAEEAIADNLEANRTRFRFNNSSLVAIDPKNGHILAMVGSADFFDEEIDGQVNVALQPRQPGSSIKPIFYAAGFEEGYTPNTILWDVETDFPISGGNYHPRNYDLRERGAVSLRNALQLSLNIPAVKMLYLVGVDNGIDFLERLHYSTFEDRSRFGLAIVLGGAEVELLEHTAAYATFANNGVYHAPTAILKVETPDGKALYEWKETDGERVVEENIAHMLSDVLSDNAARTPVFGASSPLQLGSRPVAAKTGTTNDYKDAWTMGYTPSLAAGVWSGNTNGDEMSNAGGTQAAGPVWNEFMKRALEGTAIEQFPDPKIPVVDKPMLDGKIPSSSIVIDTASGKLATDRTPAKFRQTLTCGKNHTILMFVDRENPTGPIPSNPEKDPYFLPWESAVQSYISKRNVDLDEGEARIENCTPPTESDDVHVKENEPSINIRLPRQKDEVERTFTISVNASAPRGISRLEYSINGTYIGETSSASGSTITLPTWVKAGKHTLAVTAFDDVDNSKADTVEIELLSSDSDPDSVNDITITDPLHLQTIENTGSYNVIIQASNDNFLGSLTVTVKNLWTGSTTTILNSSSPSVVNVAPWNITASGDYLITATARTTSGTVVDAGSVKVTVNLPPPPAEENEEEENE